MADIRIIMNIKLQFLISICFFGYVLSVLFYICFAQADGNTTRIEQDVVSGFDNVDIRLTNDLVSANVDNADMCHVLKALSTQSGIKLWISDKIQSKQITVHFEKQPMEEALCRLLGNNSYVFVYDSKDDNNSVRGVYILPPGEVPPENVKLVPGKNNIGLHVLIDSLESYSMPNNVKAALLNQVRANSSERQQTVTTQRTQAIYRLLEKLEEMGSADPETIRQLHEKFELQKNLKQK